MVSCYLSGKEEKIEWEKLDLVCKEGNPRELTSIGRAGIMNRAYTAFAQANGHRNFNVCRIGSNSLHPTKSTTYLAIRFEEDLVSPPCWFPSKTTSPLLEETPKQGVGDAHNLLTPKDDHEIDVAKQIDAALKGIDFYV